MKNWIKRIMGRPAPQGQAERSPASDTVAIAPVVEGAQTYSSDQPIRSKSQDKFNRWPFAKRIADTLAARKDPSSIVIGLFGPWGDGKTSTLLMMAGALAEHESVVVVQFNPWLFQSEEQLLTGFFATLADAIARSLPTAKEKIGGLLKRYGSLLSLVSIPVGPGVTIKPGEAARGLGEALSEVSLDELRQRVERFLADCGKRVVVLIDDIDRLDRNETHAILKLVKLSASFNHTSYVLSFDDEMVAASIGERYAEGGADAGRKFLEKIIQVPLHLPPPDELALRQSAFAGVEAAANTSGIPLSQEQVDTFVRHFDDGLLPRLHTPRHVNLYANAAMFALPLLKGEAHPVDVLLMEGIRVFYPNLYKTIRGNPDLFLPSEMEQQQRNDPRRARVTELIDRSLEGLGVHDKQQVRKRLIEVLFPRVGDMGYGAEWEAAWERDQRICSKHYFNRYFTYSVPPGDIGDLEVTSLLDSLASADAPESDAALTAFAQRNALPRLIHKLRRREELIDASVARRLALALARNGLVLSKERGMLSFGGTRSQAAILITQLLRRIAEGEQRETLAGELFRAVEPLPFGFECFRWTRHSDDRAEEDRVISAAAEQNVATIFVGRIRESAAEAPLYTTFGQDAPALYWLWATYGAAADVKKNLEDGFAMNPNEVDAFLDTYVGEAWGMDSGLPSRADFNREAYNAITKLVDPVTLVDKLRKRYGAEVDATEYYQGRDVPIAMRIARQFIFIHRAVENEKEQATLAAATPAVRDDGLIPPVAE